MMSTSPTWLVKTSTLKWLDMGRGEVRVSMKTMNDRKLFIFKKIKINTIKVFFFLMNMVGDKFVKVLEK